MIFPYRAGLSIVQQCRLLHLNRSGLYYRPVPEKVESLELMRLIDEQFLQTPFYGSRQMSCHGLGQLEDPLLASILHAGYRLLYRSFEGSFKGLWSTGDLQY